MKKILRREYYFALMCVFFMHLSKLGNSLIIQYLVQDLSDYIDDKDTNVEDSVQDDRLRNVYILLAGLSVNLMLNTIMVH